MKVAARRSRCRRCARVRAHTPTRTLECILRMRAYVCIRTHALLRTHTCTHTCTQSCTSSARAARDPPAHAPAHLSGPCERGGGGTHRYFRLGQSTAAGSAASSVLAAYLRATRAAAAGRLRPTPHRAPVGSARRPRARGARRRPTTGNAAAAASNAARCGPAAGAAAHAQQRSAGTAANAHGGGGRGTHRVSKSLHWPSDSGSALTFVAAMDLPRTARACGPRPPRDQGRTWGRTGRRHRKSPRIARTHTRVRVMDTPVHTAR